MTPDLFGATPELASPAIGMTVKLDRDIDRQQPCHDNLAIIRPGKPPHSGELRCATCNAHRGWLPQTVLNFITETTRRFGTPTEPIIVRQQHRENADMAFQLKPKRTATMPVALTSLAASIGSAAGSAKRRKATSI
jgi:hypothetical protein